jgi:hypothetical protein
MTTAHNSDEDVKESYDEDARRRGWNRKAKLEN